MGDPLQDRIDDLVRLARALPAERRQAFLEGATDDPALRDAARQALDAGHDPGPAPALDDPEPLGPGPLREVVARLVQRGGGDRYDVLGALGAGGQGKVLEVLDQDLQRVLAMKVMHQEGGLRDGQPTPSASHLGATRVLDEARLAARLDHPGVVPVHELGLDGEGRLYFTMKRVEGRTLAELLRERDAGDQLVTLVEVLRRVCEAMAYAHDKGVIHRDLNPGNVMVGRFGVVYVMDWGVARARDLPDHHDLRPAPNGPDSGDGQALLTMDGHVVGTPPFMSPEQAAGETERMGPATDVYAVGAMLYQLLGGRRPYVGADEQPRAWDVLERIQAGPPEPVERLAPQAPPELLSICRRAMARSPEERYPDMLALAADLTAWLEGRVVAAHASGTWAETRSWIRRHRPLAASLAAVLLLSLGFALTTSLLNRNLEDSNAALGLTNAELRQREDELQDANASLRQREDELESANTILRDNEQELQRQAQALSRANDDLASRNRDLLVIDTWRTLERLAEQVDTLWPATPAGAPALEDWLARSRDALATLEDGPAGPGLRRDHARLLERALPFDDPAAQQASLDQLRALEHRATVYAQVLERFWAAPEGQRGQLIALAREAREHERVLDAHRAEHARRFTPRFADPADTLRHERFVDLLAAVARHEDPDTGLLHGLIPGHGPGVARRLERARTLEAQTVSGPEARERWDDARQAIAAHPAYAGLDLAPVLGLLPLGPDPDSGLWEFWHTASGVEPLRDPTGRLAIDGSTGLVLVLIPGGTFLMGAQATDPKDEGHDPLARPDEFPPHAVTLAPYLLSKYEVTQGQWRRLSGSEPSAFSRWSYAPVYEREFAAAHDPDRHPVDSVSWHEARRVLAWHGLDLPSEAQWERAHRAGGEATWVFGDEPQQLAGHANLADSYMAANGGALISAAQDWLDDGHAVHAEVGSFAPNAFGLHDMAGNVWEWCRDLFVPEYHLRHPDNGLDAWPDSRGTRSDRGGGFKSPAAESRAAARNLNLPDHEEDDQGLRPVLELTGA